MADDGIRAEQPGTLTEQLYNQLRRDIVLGDLKPGARLKLDGLSADYKVSVNTLRETLSRLASEGLVIAEGQRGFAVPPVSMEDLRDITEMRALLECHALMESIANADLEWEAGVVAAYHKLSRIEAVVEDAPERYGADWERYNQEFHAALIARCDSRWLKLFHKAMYDHSQRYRMLSLTLKPFPRVQSALEHKALHDAALARDAEGAVAALRQHILKAGAAAGVEAGPSAKVGKARKPPAKRTRV